MTRPNKPNPNMLIAEGSGTFVVGGGPLVGWQLLESKQKLNILFFPPGFGGDAWTIESAAMKFWKSARFAKGP